MSGIAESYFGFGPDVPKDRVTLGVPVITTDHALIHEGLAFSLTGTFAANGTAKPAIGIKPPAAVAASATVVMTDTDANLTYTYKETGPRGNLWKVVHVDPEDEDQELTVTVDSYVITVSLATDEAGEITSLSADVVEAVNASEAGQFVVCAEAGDGGAVNAVSIASLAGGTDALYVHFKAVGITAAAAVVTVSLVENTEVTGTALELTPVDLNRVTANTSKCTITATLESSRAPGGVLLKTLIARGTAQGAARYSDDAGYPEEIVFKPGLNYVLEFAPAGATAIDYQIFWYEESSV